MFGFLGPLIPIITCESRKSHVFHFSNLAWKIFGIVVARKQEEASKNNSSLEFKPMTTFWFTVAEPPSPPINPLQSLKKYLMRLTSRCVPNFYCLAFLVVSDCQILMPSCINHFQRRQLSFLQHKKRKWKNVSEVFIYQNGKTSFCNWEREEKKTFSKDKNEEGLKQRNCFFEKRKREEKNEQHVLWKRKEGYPSIRGNWSLITNICIQKHFLFNASSHLV